MSLTVSVEVSKEVGNVEKSRRFRAVGPSPSASVCLPLKCKYLPLRLTL